MSFLPNGTKLFYDGNAAANAESQRKAEQRRKLEAEADAEWAAFEKPTLEQRIAKSQERMKRAIENAFWVEEK